MQVHLHANKIYCAAASALSAGSESVGQNSGWLFNPTCPNCLIASQRHLKEGELKKTAGPGHEIN